MEKSRVSIKGIKIGAIFICLIFTLSFSLFAFMSLLRYYENRRELEVFQSRLLNLEEDAKNFEKLLENYKEERELFKKLLFTEKDIASFLDEISQFAKKAKVKIVNMQTRHFKKVELEEIDETVTPLVKKRRKKSSKKESKIAPALLFMPINMKIEGSFSSLVDFLIFLEKYRQLIALTDVGINIKKYPTLSCSFTLRIYSLKEKK